MDISLQLYNGVLYIPTSYHVERNRFFFEGAPVASVPVEQTDRLRREILMAIERGNPQISFEEYRSQLDSKADPILKATGARSWYALDRQTHGTWSLAEQDGLFAIQVWRPMKTRGWDADVDKAVKFPAGTSLNDVVARLIAMIQERARE